LTAAWFVLAVSWQSWTERSLDWKQAIIVGLILVIVVITTSLIAHARRAPLARIMPWSCIIVAMIAAAFLGPMSWAQASINGHEPMHGSRALVLLDDSERPWRIQASEPTDNMYVYLANYFLAQHQLDDAQRYAVRASKYSPNDPLAWFYLGLVYDEQGRGIDERRAVWRRALDLNPDSQVIRQRWQRVQ
jgi:tetratricopeptide (TPR) repeat protein